MGYAVVRRTRAGGLARWCWPGGAGARTGSWSARSDPWRGRRRRQGARAHADLLRARRPGGAPHGVGQRRFSRGTSSGPSDYNGSRTRQT